MSMASSGGASVRGVMEGQGFGCIDGRGRRRGRRRYRWGGGEEGFGKGGDLLGEEGIFDLVFRLDLAAAACAAVDMDARK